MLTVFLASVMVLRSAGLFLVDERYFRAIVWCHCLMVWMPDMEWV